MNTVSVDLTLDNLLVIRCALEFCRQDGLVDVVDDALKRLARVGQDVHTVFLHWQKIHKKERSRLDKKRETRIRNMLKTFSVDELKQAIDGALKDDWLMGKGKAPRAYNGLETILRDAAQVERLIELGTPRITVTVKHMSVADVIPEVAKGGYI